MNKPLKQEAEAVEVGDDFRRKGTALAVPHYAENDLGFSPEGQFLKRTRTVPRRPKPRVLGDCANG
jgi:hypothetical protein